MGINHQIQWVRIWSAGSSSSGNIERFEREQKDHFRELLRKRIIEENLQFIGEETKHGEQSIAEQLCSSIEECRHANIDMTLDGRAARNIPVNYENLRITPSEQAFFNQKREEYMFKKAIEESRGAERAMMICGYQHTEALANRFRKAGHEVEEADIRNEPWYIEDWLSQMQRM